MAYDPNIPTPVKVEIFAAGNWVEVTSRTRAATGIVIKRGQSPGAVQPETDTMRCTIENEDGELTEGNPMSGWWPDIGRGCKIRVSLTGILGSDAQRFQGQINTMVARYPDGVDSVMDITAIGTWGVLVQSAEPLAGAMERAILGGATIPVGYWQMYDPTGSTGFASSLPGGGQPMVFELAEGIYETPGWRGVTQPPGGGPNAAATLNDSLAYTPPLSVAAPWSVSFAIRRPSDFVDGSAIAAVYFLLNGTETVVPINGPSAIDAVGEATWWHYYVTGTQVAGDAVLSLWRNGEPRTGATYAGQTMGAITRFSAQSSAAVDEYSMVEVAVYDSASIDYQTHSDALQGWAGETDAARAQRLCDEEGIDIEITGTSAITMGVQEPNTLPNLLEECALAGQALLGDGGTDGALTYLCNSEMYNAAAAVTITAGSIMLDIAPRWDRQDTANDITSRLPDGSSYRAIDEAHIADTNARIKRAPTVNLETSALLPHDANWRLRQGTLPGPRYPQWTINMRQDDAALLAPTMLLAKPGSRITVAASVMPDSHPAGGMDQLMLGWTERLDVYGWAIDPHTRPWGHDIAVYGVDPGGIVSRYGAASTVLAEALTDVETAADVDSDGEVWATTATHPSAFPFDVTIGGLVYSCTAITGTAPLYTLTLVRLATDKTHSSGAAVTVTDTGRYAL